MESNIRAPVLLNSLTRCEKSDKMLAKFPTRFINSITYEHSGKILYKEVRALRG